MAFTRDVNLNFNSATKVINGAPQEFKEDVACDKDLAVAGDLAVTGSFTFAGPPPVWVLAPLTLSNTLTLDGAGALGDFTMDHGDMTLTDGDIVLTNGAITAAVGNISATTGDVLVPAGNVTVGTGNVAIAVAGSFSTLLGDITTTAGNLVTTLGDLTLTNGDATITQGNLSVLNTVPGTDGNVTVGRMVELLSNAAAVAPAAGGGTLTNDTGELIWRVGAVEQSVTRTGLSTVVGAVQTTDATPTDVVSIAITDEHMVTVHGVIHGWTAAGAEVFVGHISGSAYRTAAGIAVLAGTGVTEIADTIAATVTVAVDGANAIVVHIVGAAKTTEWHCELQVYDTTLVA